MAVWQTVGIFDGNVKEMSELQLHIGSKIRARLDQTKMSIAEFARQMEVSRPNAYAILENGSIDTDSLMRASRILEFDFFEYYRSWNQQTGSPERGSSPVSITFTLPNDKVKEVLHAVFGDVATPHIIASLPASERFNV